MRASTARRRTQRQLLAYISTLESVFDVVRTAMQHAKVALIMLGSTQVTPMEAYLVDLSPSLHVQEPDCKADMSEACRRRFFISLIAARSDAFHETTKPKRTNLHILFGTNEPFESVPNGLLPCFGRMDVMKLFMRCKRRTVVYSDKSELLEHSTETNSLCSLDIANAISQSSLIWYSVKCAPKPPSLMGMASENDSGQPFSSNQHDRCISWV